MSFKDNFSANVALAFDQFSKLPETLEPTLTEVIKFVGHSVKSNDPTDTKRFNWKDFKAALDRYPGADLTFDMFKTTVVSQTDPTAVSMVVKKIAQFLFDALQAEVDLHELETTIEATFTHLKEKKEKGSQISQRAPPRETAPGSTGRCLRSPLPISLITFTAW